MGTSEKISLHCSHLKLCRHKQIAFKRARLGRQLTLSFLRALVALILPSQEESGVQGSSGIESLKRVKGKCSVLSSETASPAADKRVKNLV